MKKILTILLGLLAPLLLAAGQENPAPIKPDKTVYLYPEGQVSGKAGEDNGLRGPETEKPGGKIANIGDGARMEFYFPEKPCGLMVIICAGGSYSSVSALNEGYCAAEWLKGQGVASCVLLYRLPAGHKTVPLTDVHNAIRYCRAHAAEWGVGKLGVMGFSAGGHLAASAATLYSDRVTRPDFSVLIYPVINMMDDAVCHAGSRRNLLGDNPSAEDCEHYTLHRRVNPDTPPTFIALSANDGIVSVKNSLDYFAALCESDVDAHMHIYPSGGHGWGFGHPPYTEIDKLGRYRKLFFADFSRFLKDMSAKQ